MTRLEELARFKLGDPAIIDLVFSSAMIHIENERIGKGTIITGPPVGSNPSAISIVIKKLSRYFGINAVFPVKTRSASGYSMINDHGARKTYIRNQFEYAESFKDTSVYIVDDVIWSGSIICEIEKQIEKSEGIPKGFYCHWDFRGCKDNKEYLLRSVIRQLVDEKSSEEMGKWEKTNTYIRATE